MCLRARFSRVRCRLVALPANRQGQRLTDVPMSTRVRKPTQFGRFGHPRASRPRGAIPGANGGRYRATQGDWPRQFAQLNALPNSTTAPLKKSCDGAGTPGQLLPPWRAEVSVPGRRISRYLGVRHSTAVAGSAPAASAPPAASGSRGVTKQGTVPALVRPRRTRLRPPRLR